MIEGVTTAYNCYPCNHANKAQVHKCGSAYTKPSQFRYQIVTKYPVFFWLGTDDPIIRVKNFLPHNNKYGDVMRMSAEERKAQEKIEAGYEAEWEALQTNKELMKEAQQYVDTTVHIQIEELAKYRVSELDDFYLVKKGK